MCCLKDKSGTFKALFPHNLNQMRIVFLLINQMWIVMWLISLPLDPLGRHCEADINECEKTKDICNYGICVNNAGKNFYYNFLNSKQLV